MEPGSGLPPVELTERTDRRTLGAFWLSVIAVAASSVATVFVLSHFFAPGELAEVFTVFGLSFVAAVIPVAVQSQAAARRASGGRSGVIVWEPVCTGVALAVLAAPIAGRLLGVSMWAVALPALQVIPAVAVAVGRGELIALRRYRVAAANHWFEAAIRVMGGVSLGLLLGPDGVALALVLAALGSWVTLRYPAARERERLVLPGAVTALALFTAAVHLDVLLAPRLFGVAADEYAVAALPAKGVFLALMAAGWLVIPAAARFTRRRDALIPILGTTAAGFLLAAVVAVALPLIATFLGREGGDHLVAFVLGLAMAAAAGTWVCLQVLLTHNNGRLWLPATVAVAMIVTIAAVSRSPLGLAIGMLVGQTAALVASIAAVTRRPTVHTGAIDTMFIDLRENTAGGVSAARRPSRLRRFVAGLAQRLDDAAIPTTVAWAPARRTPRILLGAVSALMFAAMVMQRPGSIVHETKLDVAIDPARFLSRTFHLWEPVADMGHVQNQAVGYLFPMGPFYLLGHLLRVPVWLIQRGFSAAVLVAAFWGLVRLADAFGIGTPRTRIVGGLAYALSPLFIARIGNTSAMVMGAAFLPWVLLPLVRASRIGSPRRAGALAGLAVLCMGGVNAAVTFAVLPAPLIFLATRKPGGRRRALLFWFAFATVLATTWFLIPLFFQQKFGFNFLPFTERAETTTAVGSTTEALRGTADWLSYLHLGEAWLPAGWELVVNPVVIVATSLVAAIGLAALVRRDQPERTFLAYTLGAGVVAVVAGYGGWFGNPAAAAARSLLDGPLGLFRNVYKFQPLVLLPLALGFTHQLVVAGRWVARHASAFGFTGRAASRLSWGPVVIGLVMVVLAALPIVNGRLFSDRGFEQIPDYWREVVAYNDEHAGSGRALLVPGLSFGDYTWGRTEDEPLQALADSPWAVRSLIPLGSAGETRALDAVERAIARGGSPGLGPMLSRLGVSRLVVRNDANWRRWGAPRPLQVRAALENSGLQQVAAFGPDLGATRVSRELTGLLDQGIAVAERELRAVEIYEVPNSRLVSAAALDDALVVSGGPEALLTLGEQGVTADRPVVLASDYPATEPLPGNLVVTDSLRRRDTEFGLMRDNLGTSLERDETVGGREPAQLLPSAGTHHQSAAVLEGIRGISASSYGSWLYAIAESAPFSAIDGDPATSWVTGATESSEGEWLQVDLDNQLETETIGVRLLLDGPWRPVVRSIRVTTENGSVVTDVDATEDLQQVKVPTGRSRWLRVSFEAIDGESDLTAHAGIRELEIPGVSARRLIEVSNDLTDIAGGDHPAPSYVFERDAADPRDLFRRDEEAQLARRFTVPTSSSYAPVAMARAVPGAKLDALLDSFSTRTPGFEVTASSSLLGLPEYRPSNLVDGNPATVWFAAPTPAAVREGMLVPVTGGALDARNGTSRAAAAANAPATDPDPTIQLRWRGLRSVDSIVLAPAKGASRPVRVHISSPAGERDAPVPPDGIVRFAALTTDRLSVSFPELQPGIGALPDGAGELAEGSTVVAPPVGFSSIDVPALGSARIFPADPSTPVTIGCQEGPAVSVAGRTVRFAADTTIGALASLRPFALRPCGGARLNLPSGTHDLAATSGTAPLVIQDVVLRSAAFADGAATGRAVTVRDWGEDHRQIEIAAGGPALLAIAENHNIGWKARLDGRELQPIRLEGWKQGFVVPGGSGGVIDLVYTPARNYQAALVLGLLLVGVLVALWLVPHRGRAVTLDRVAPRALPRWLAVALAAFAAIWVSGLAAVALPLLVVASRRWRGLLAVVAAGGVALAGMIAAAGAPPSPGEGTGAFGTPAQLLAGLAFLAVIAATIAPRSRRARGSGTDHGRDSARRPDLFDFVPQAAAGPRSYRPLVPAASREGRPSGGGPSWPIHLFRRLSVGMGRS